MTLSNPKAQGFSLHSIAQQLVHTPSILSRELARNSDFLGYTSREAQYAYQVFAEFMQAIAEEENASIN